MSIIFLGFICFLILFIFVPNSLAVLYGFIMFLGACTGAYMADRSNKRSKMKHALQGFYKSKGCKNFEELYYKLRNEGVDVDKWITDGSFMEEFRQYSLSLPDKKKKV